MRWGDIMKKTVDLVRGGVAMGLCLAWGISLGLAGSPAQAAVPAARKAPAPAQAASAPKLSTQNAREVNYAPAPAWVIAAPEPTATADTPGAALRVVYSDTQVRATDAGTQTFADYRIKVLKPEALALGNLNLTWQPDGGSVTVHAVKIIRDGAVIDVLDKTRFRVIEREQNLDQASLDGLLSAVLQVPGLQVGDTLEFSATIAERDQTLGDLAFGMQQMPTASTNGTFRYRLTWPVGQQLFWQTTKDFTPPAVHTENGINEIRLELRDPAGSVPTDRAPPRYNIRHLVEYTGFDGWTDLSKRMYPLFDKASTVAATSPVQAEIDRIKAQSSDPVVRAQLALSLVEDRIRYVYVGLNGGNYRPAGIDETWDHKYGDCKGKTALLLALLHGLGIDAEAVLVNSHGGDGINEWLANPMMFDHVLVRAHIGDKSYWLDGTRAGDTRLDQIPAPQIRWALSVRAEGAAIEAIKPEPYKEPEDIENIDIDARAGFDAPAKVSYQDIYHGDRARILKMQLEAMAPQDATQTLKSGANKGGAWTQLDSVDWHFDADKNVLVLTFKGTWILDWRGSDAEGHSYNLPGAGFYPPDERHRASEQDQDAPWIRESFPSYDCYTTTVHLPQKRKGWDWGYDAEAMDKRLDGQTYWRQAGLKDGVVRTVMSSNVYAPEITAAEAKAVNLVIPKFNNNQSQVFEAKGAAAKPSATLPFGDDATWDDLVKTCTPH